MHDWFPNSNFISTLFIYYTGLDGTAVPSKPAYHTVTYIE